MRNARLMKGNCVPYAFNMKHIGRMHNMIVWNTREIMQGGERRGKGVQAEITKCSHRFLSRERSTAIPPTRFSKKGDCLFTSFSELVRIPSPAKEGQFRNALARSSYVRTETKESIIEIRPLDLALLMSLQNLQTGVLVRENALFTFLARRRAIYNSVDVDYTNPLCNKLLSFCTERRFSKHRHGRKWLSSTIILR